KVFPITGLTQIREVEHIIYSETINSITKNQKYKGISLKTGTALTLDDVKNDDNLLVETVVSHNSSLINRTFKQANFKNRYDAGVIAIHRNNQRIKSRVGDIVLKTEIGRAHV